MATKDHISLTEAIKLKNDGNWLYKVGKFELAIAKYNQAIDVCPQNKLGELAVFYQNRAACFEALNEWQKVVDDCTKAIKFNHIYAKAFKRRSNAYKKLGKLGYALNDMAVLCLISGLQWKDDPIIEYNTTLREFSEREGKRFFLSRGDITVPDQVIRSHFELFTSNGFIDGEVDNAVLRDQIQKNKLNNTDEYRFAKVNAIEGTIQFLKLNYSEAEEYFNTVINENCDKELKVYSFIMLALCSFHSMIVGVRNEQVIPKIMQHFDNALNVDPNNGDIFFHRTPFIDYLNRGGYDRTIDHLRKCVELSPNNITAKAQLLYYRSLKTLVTKDANEINDIIKCFRENLKIYPNSTSMIYYYLASLADTFQPQHRIRDCVKYALECKTDDKNFSIHKAFVYQYGCTGIGDDEEMIRMFMEAVRADEQCQFGHEMLAVKYITYRKFSESIKHLDKALKVARTEKECVNLVRFKALLESQISANKSVNEVNTIIASQMVTHRLMKQSFDELFCNWCAKHVYNGIPINCSRSKFL